jgi:hypothetical protein
MAVAYTQGALNSQRLSLTIQARWRNLRSMSKPVLPSQALEYFKAEGRRGGASKSSKKLAAAMKNLELAQKARTAKADKCKAGG